MKSRCSTIHPLIDGVDREMKGVASCIGRVRRSRRQQKGRERALLPNGDYGGEHFNTAAVPTLPLETAAVVSNRF